MTRREQEKTTQDRIAAAKARIAKATAAAPLPGGKKTDTPELSRRASAEGEAVPLAHEEEKTTTTNASVDATVESNVTLENSEAADEEPEKTVEEQQEETVTA